jgi:hypothetical protein
MERLGRYVLLQRVGAGGMAEVFRAATLGVAGFSRQVAVKRILGHLSSYPPFVEMFLDEARLASSLLHPNILPVLDLGQEGETYFMALEYVAGASLDGLARSLAARGQRMDTAFVLHVGCQVLRGLAHAHEQVDAAGRPRGIIHRDVSPHNILVGFDGRVFLADFGVARARDRVASTQSGGIKGKYGYWAPELVRGGEVDHRVDLYALGATLHELLSGQKFREGGGPAMEALGRVASGEFVPLDRACPGLPPPAPVVAAVHRALHPEPGTRWATARVMEEALEAAARGLGPVLTGAEVAERMVRWLPARHAAEVKAQAYFREVARALADAGGEQGGVRARQGAQPLDGAPAHVPGDHPFFPPPAFDQGPTAVDLAALPPPPEFPEEELPQGGGTVRAARPVAASLPATGRPGRGHKLGWVAAAAVAAGLGVVALWAGPSWVGPAFKPTPPQGDTSPRDPPPATPQDVGEDDALTFAEWEVEEEEAGPATGDKASEKPRSPGPPARLSVQSHPWAKVIVDGKDRGLFTPVTVHLRPGRHRVELVNPQFDIQWSTVVHAKAGERLDLVKSFP